MPTAIQPLKHGGPHATDTQRVEMLRLATSDESSWRVCTLEIDRGGRSYTVDTLRQIHEELPEAQLFFLIGADALRDVPRWKEPAKSSASRRRSWFTVPANHSPTLNRSNAVAFPTSDRKRSKCSPNLPAVPRFAVVSLLAANLTSSCPGL